MSGFRNLNSPHKPLPILVDSARAGARTYTALRSSGQPPGLARASVAENAVGDLVTDPPAEAMHDRTHERGTLIGRKDRDRVDVQADEDEESHDDASWG